MIKKMLDNLYKFSLEGKMTDIVLEIEDDNSIIIMSLHKNILAASCCYFDRLFNGNFIDSNTQKVKINVPNSLITKNIIKSFYGQENDVIDIPDWQYILEEIICKDYFGLDYNTSKLKDINVPNEYYDLLVHVAGIVGFNNPNIINLLTDLMPPDYDLTNISKDDIEFLLNRTGDCIFSLHHNVHNKRENHYKYCLKILDNTTGNIIKTTNKYITKKFEYDHTNNEIMYIDFDKKINTSLIKCLKLSTNSEYEIEQSHNVKNIVLSNDGKILISYHIEKSETKFNSGRRSNEIVKSCLFKFFDVSDKKILFSFYVKDIVEKNTPIINIDSDSEDDSPDCNELSNFFFEIKFMDFSSDNKYLVCCFTTGFSLCLNIETKEILWTTHLRGVDRNFYFNNSILSSSLYIVSLKNIIHVVDVSDGNILKEIKINNEGVYNFDDNIMMIYHSSKIEIYDWKNDKTIRTIKSTEKIFKHIYDPRTMTLYSSNIYDNIMSYTFNNFDVNTFTGRIILEDCDEFVLVNNYNQKIQDKLSNYLKTQNKTSEYDCVGLRINEID
ncbi:putative BTB/POZ domain-containing protein [Acanthamoeba polyphaga mimivirus]|uniref:BTB/POZ domain-containing protein n=1 Tax=Acanthamoeba polyphaga mimivirus Kroon TaxID=3069720 RepID=A0A0G2Y5G3_9VIRU|nr:putative BTB/POZ domain-containing protein [Acanthamoeba polyphaga mimivirus]AKI79814.1 putative BTB/POZ domain-containing protein [Acanthamoeba polyphaga mimivirus Kroon]